MDAIQRDNTNDEVEDEFGGRLFVSFTLTGRDLIPSDVTTILEIQSSYSFKRGDIKINSNGEKQVRKHSCWDLNSDNKGFPSDDPGPHFEWLLSKLEPVQAKLNDLLVNKNIKARIQCFWITPDGRINIEVEPAIIMRLAKLNLKIW